MDSREIEKLAHGLPGFGNSGVANINLTSGPMTLINLRKYFF